MIESDWLIIIIWFALLAFSYSVQDKIWRVGAGIVGIVVGLILANEALTMVQYVGFAVILLNFYVCSSTILKRN